MDKILSVILIMMLTFIPPPKNAEPSYEVTISASGDVMTLSRQLDTHYDRASKQYDFTGDYGPVEPIIQAADCSIANLESTLGYEGNRTSINPRFNAPDALADALKHAGYDILGLANNHVNDYDDAYIFRTLDVLKNRGFDVIGLRRKDSEKNYLISVINGIKIGFSAYTFETGQTKAGIKAINGRRMTPRSSALLNSYRKDLPREDLDAMKRTVDNMRRSGAEYIIFYVHWGLNACTVVQPVQKQLARYLSDCGVNVIFGMHPHYLQPVDVITSPISHTQTLVFYSLGNLVSNMAGNKGGLNATDTIIAGIKVKKDAKTGKVTLSEAGYLPISCIRTSRWYYLLPVKGERGILPQYASVYARIDRVIGMSARAVTSLKIQEWLTPADFTSK